VSNAVKPSRAKRRAAGRRGLLPIASRWTDGLFVRRYVHAVRRDIRRELAEQTVDWDNPKHVEIAGGTAQAEERGKLLEEFAS
jgi:hypothetical protein